MGFIFGLILGGLLASGDGTTPNQLQQSLSQIPLRCFAALDESEDTYRTCRAPSLAGELGRSSTADAQIFGFCTKAWREQYPDKTWAENCNLGKHLTWEIAALRQLAEATKAKKAEQKSFK